MAIIALQRSIAEAGRIRIGHQVPIGNGRTRPAKLDTFRLTSADRQRIEEAAALFGGTVKPWQAPAGAQWEVITEATAIDVIVPPQAMAFSQYYELWSAGGCQRRCDGEFESLTEQECLCDPVARECEMHTRLSLMIRDLPGLGLWRIDSQGYYAAREIAGAVEIMAMAAGRGILLPARLLLEQRSVKRPGKDGKPQTLRFPVPRLDPGITPGELLLAGHTNGTTLPELTEGSQRPKLLPVPVDETPVPSIAEQSAPPAAKTPRRNAAPEIPASGRTRAAGTKQAGEPGYWRARTFAAAGERGVDADALRPIAAQMFDGDEDGFSLANLDEDDWERLYGVVVAFTTPPSAAEPQESETLGGWAIEEAPADPPAAASDLVTKIREAADASKAKGQMTAVQRKAVYEQLVTPVGARSFHAVVVAAYGDSGFRAPSAAQAAGLLTIADSFPDPGHLVAAWHESAAAVPVPA